MLGHAKEIFFSNPSATVLDKLKASPKQIFPCLPYGKKLFYRMETISNRLVPDISAQGKLVALHNYITAQPVTKLLLWKDYGHMISKEDAIHTLLRSYLKEQPKEQRKLLNRVIRHPECQLDHKLIASHELLKSKISLNSHFNALESDEFKLIQSQSQKNQSTALYILGLLHMEHPEAIGCRKSNIKQALHYFNIAQIYGNRLADASIGYIFKNLYSDIGMAKDEAHTKAIFHYQYAANLGHAPAANSLGLSYRDNTLPLYTSSEGSALASAITRFKQALDNRPHCPETLYNLAITYNNASNRIEAYQYFSQAADLGHTDSKIQLAFIYGDPKLAQDAGLEGPNYPKEFELLQEAVAEKTQNRWVFHRVGMIYYDNKLASQAGLPDTDLKNARLAFELAAKLGHTDAKNALGTILYNSSDAKSSGLNGPNHTRALELFEEAVKDSPSNPRYCYNLANALVLNGAARANRVLSLYEIGISDDNLLFTFNLFRLLTTKSRNLTSHFRTQGLILVRKVLANTHSPATHSEIHGSAPFIPAAGTWNSDESTLYIWQLYQIFKCVGANHLITIYIDPRLSNAHKQILIVGDNLLPLYERYKALLQLRHQNDSARSLTYHDGIPERTVKNNLKSIADALESAIITRPNSVTEIWGDTYANRLFSLIGNTPPILKSSKSNDIKWCREDW